jgi:class 3 adenylate cyclase
MFTDFKDFTTLSEKLTPDQLVSEIDYCFRAFDEIVDRNNVEKIKTIGDSYMAAGGLPVPSVTHAKDVMNAAIEILDFIQKHNEKRLQENQFLLDIRIGIHTGSVVAGIVGTKKFVYDIWGDAVNTASRMESSGVVGKINLSGDAYELLKNDFNFIHRGKIEAKNKGLIDMYLLA